MPHLYRVILPVSDIDCEGTILACFDPKTDGDGYTAKPNPEPLYFSVSDLRSATRCASCLGPASSRARCGPSA